MGVWSYDFVEAQTHDGRKLRLMTLIDEFTRSPPFGASANLTIPCHKDPPGGTPSNASTVWHRPTRRTIVLSADSYHDRSSAHLAQYAGNHVFASFLTRYAVSDYSTRWPARQPISQTSASSRVASLKITISSASRAGVT